MEIGGKDVHKLRIGCYEGNLAIGAQGKHLSSGLFHDEAASGYIPEAQIKLPKTIEATIGDAAEVVGGCAEASDPSQLWAKCAK